MLLSLAIGLALLDLVTTVIGVRMAGAAIEANGFHRAVIARAGLTGFVLVYVAGVAGLIAMLDRLDALIGLVAVLLLTVLNNGYALLRLWRSRRP
ncbi:hypothetical protein [Gemmatimonas sp.]|uniref:hypothetical protein n=1 Tax=Gemmatimonas sp. TaxID=1962908 RepID=UPI0025BFA6EC|nr:hypothetical protein [Gemmatimonas sp.]MCA2990008.1 hypothetical protein [Gemmatimonas sp.]